MGNESDTWVMYGVDWNNTECIHTVREAMEYMHEAYPIATDKQIRKLLR